MLGFWFWAFGWTVHSTRRLVFGYFGKEEEKEIHVVEIGFVEIGSKEPYHPFVLALPCFGDERKGWKCLERAR
jgi:hypothetical protein